MTEHSKAGDDNPSGDRDEREASQPRRRRVRRRPIPALTFEEALVLGRAIQTHAAGGKVRRLTLFDNMGRSAEGGTARTLVTASGQYGITSGGYNADYLELTPDGSLATAEDTPPEQRVRARFRLAVESNPWFKHLYDSFKDNRLPSQQVLADSVREERLDADYLNECVETFMVNAKFLGLLRTVAGAERLITLDHLVEEYATQRDGGGSEETAPAVEEPRLVEEREVPRARLATSTGAREFERVCFYISPIGSEGSEQRQHADLFMGSLVEPALEELNLKLVRADQIGEPGLITAQVIEHIVRAPLVIADLSYHNPNVFYELALRHAVRRPIVQLIRAADRIPFDLQPFRTIVVDTTSIYTLVPRLETYKAEIASQVRMAMESSDGESDSPLSTFYPEFWDNIRT